VKSKTQLAKEKQKALLGDLASKFDLLQSESGAKVKGIEADTDLTKSKQDKVNAEIAGIKLDTDTTEKGQDTELNILTQKLQNLKTKGEQGKQDLATGLLEQKNLKATEAKIKAQTSLFAAKAISEVKAQTGRIITQSQYVAGATRFMNGQDPTRILTGRSKTTVGKDGESRTRDERLSDLPLEEQTEFMLKVYDEQFIARAIAASGRSANPQTDAIPQEAVDAVTDQLSQDQNAVPAPAQQAPGGLADALGGGAVSTGALQEVDRATLSPENQAIFDDFADAGLFTADDIAESNLSPQDKNEMLQLFIGLFQ